MDIQARAAQRAFLARAAAVYDSIHHDDMKPFATTPRVKREALGDAACGPAYKLRSKKNRAERIAARA